MLRRFCVIVAAAGLSAAALISIGSAGAGGGWAGLARPLHLPTVHAGAACPISRVDSRVPWSRIDIFGGSGIGSGPVYPGLGRSGGLLRATRDDQFGGPWFGSKVFWYVAPSYRGPVLVRGRRLDGPQHLGFNGAKVAAGELQIAQFQTVTWSGQPKGSRGVPSGVRALAAGCYGVQVDGTSFSRVIVFKVDLAR